MLDPRIYRTGLIVVAVAVIVVAFSLGNQAKPLNATLVPDAFNGGTAYATMQPASPSSSPSGPPGSVGDNGVADDVASAFSRDGLQVQRSTFNAQTIDGARTIQTVTGTLAGLTPGSIVIVAHRDSAHAGAASDLSGTAVLLELAQVLSAQTQQRSVVLASTSASIGAAGAAQLARSLPQPVDAVIVLGDMAGTMVRTPIVVPWSRFDARGADAAAQHRRHRAGSSRRRSQSAMESLGGQFLHLAFPLAASEQATVRRQRRAGGARLDLGIARARRRRARPASTRSPGSGVPCCSPSARSRRARRCRRRRPTCAGRAS